MALKLMINLLKKIKGNSIEISLNNIAQITNEKMEEKNEKIDVINGKKNI